MPLQIRRGTTAQRLSITPLPGELIYDTTTGQIFVGNGSTAGGVVTTGVSLEDARDAAASLLTSGVHSGITFSYNDALDRIDATVTIGGIGPFDGDISGSVFADNSTLLVDAVTASIPAEVIQGTFASIDINGGAIDGVVIGGNSPAAITGTTVTASSGFIGNISSTGSSSFSNVDVNGGTIDGATIGGSSPAAITGTTITATNEFVGTITGDVTGSIFADDSTILVDAVSAEIKGTINATGISHTITSNVASNEVGVHLLYPNNFTSTLIDSRLKVRIQGLSASTDHGIALELYESASVGPKLTLRKFRGTLSSPSTIIAGDSLGDVLFVGRTEVTNGVAGRISYICESTPGPVDANSRAALRFYTYDGSTFAVRAEINSSGVFKTNAIENYSGSNLSLTATNLDHFGMVNVKSGLARNELRFFDTDNTNYVALRSSNTVSSNIIFDLPDSYGSSNNVLISNGSGVLSWSSVQSILPSQLTIDVIGSIFADDSTLLVNGIDKTISGNFVGTVAVSSTNAAGIHYLTFTDTANGNSSLQTDTSLSYNPAGNYISCPAFYGSLVGNVNGDLYGSIFAHDSTQIIDHHSSSIRGSDITSTSYIQYPVYANPTARDSAIPNPAAGMVVFLTDNGSAVSKLQVNTDSTLTGWVDLH